ncbi:hypothetical protein B0H17DRAFT_1130447 [Mycena rosella]|uniref:Uncharacterized protein n=1 Tax=Mycena rosella TaxID=1033263 RepID=A0AAD7GM78_MYCRO|nr:hypothetical protein B0H17DRAFT_1130447 [Mycena rosella]
MTYHCGRRIIGGRNEWMFAASSVRRGRVEGERIVKYKAIDREVAELLAFICAKTREGGTVGLQNTSISGLCRDHCGKREIAKIQTRFYETKEFVEGEETVVVVLIRADMQQP